MRREVMRMRENRMGMAWNEWDEQNRSANNSAATQPIVVVLALYTVRRRREVWV